MWCGRCDTDIKDCKCPGLEEKLDACEGFIYRKCAECGKHYARCKCENPRWISSDGSVEILLQKDGSAKMIPIKGPANIH